jgi:hypothetical protein
MKVRIDTHFMDFEAGKWRTPGQIVEVRNTLGEEWVSKQWGIELKEPVLEKEVIETPEDQAEPAKRERATLKRKTDE